MIDDTVVVFGYGSQGRSIALNLRDSGFNVVVGLRKKSTSMPKARRDGFPAAPFNEAIKQAGIIIVALPDDCHQTVFEKIPRGCLNRSTPLVFLHGSTIHFGLVTPPKDVPVLLLAPHAPGLAVRANYLNKTPFSAFYAVHQGPKKRGYELLVRLAKGIGIGRGHLIKTTFADEAVGDLFGEQAVLCGGLARLLKFGFETLVEAGLPPQNAYLEVAHQIDLIVELIKRHGLAGMFERISPLARYGSAIHGPKVVSSKVKAEMREVYDVIASGRFIRDGMRAGLKVGRKQMAELTSPAFDRQVKRFNKGR